MSKLFVRSFLVLTLLFGMVFAVGTAVLYHYHCPLIWALGLAVIVVTLQYILSPYIIDWIYHINWTPPRMLAPEFAEFLEGVCKKRGIAVPRFGIIEDGNPNAFTYGHVPSNARLVVTRGLLQMLDREEYEAVIAHEIGHIRHYDFIVMTFASLAPLMLYMLYRWTRDRRDGIFAVSIGAYVAYIVSQYIVLFLSRVREFYADEHAANIVSNPNSLSTALVKIAYGLARINQQPDDDGDQKKNKQPALNKSQLMGSLGVCSFGSAVPMALYSTNAAGQFAPDHMVRAMQWDLWNPWAKFFELNSTHPLVAQRVRAASRIAMRRNQQPAFPLTSEPRESCWPTFLMDLLFLALPWIGVALGLLFAYGRGFSGADANPFGWFVSSLKLVFLFGGIGWLIRLSFSYGGSFKKSTVVELVGDVDVSHIRSIPVELEGEVIGRGVPGLFWSKDLVMQDESGFVTLIYRQPLGFLETLFGIFGAEWLIGQKGKIRGWYRRGPIPYVELKEADFANGRSVRCYYYVFTWAMALLTTLVGAYMTFASMGH